jgi:hypothetical protein
MNVGIEKVLEYKENLTKRYFSQEMFKEDLMYAKRKSDQLIIEELDFKAENVLLDLISAKNTSPKIEYKNLALKKIEELTEKENIILAKSLNWVNKERKILDQQQYDFLIKFNKETEEKWLQWISSNLLKNWQ